MLPINLNIFGNVPGYAHITKTIVQDSFPFSHTGGQKYIWWSLCLPHGHMCCCCAPLRLAIVGMSVQGFPNIGTLQNTCVGSWPLKLKGIPFISYIYLGNVTDSWGRKRESKQRMEKDVIRSLHNVTLNQKRPRSTFFLYEHRPHKGSCWTSPEHWALFSCVLR